MKTSSKFLVTASLLNSFFYFKNYDEDILADKFGSGDYVPKSNEEIRKEFLQTLSRDKFEPSEAMQKGIDFENKVQFLTTNLTVEDLRNFYHEETGQTVINNKLTIADVIEWLEKRPDYLIAQIVKNGIWQTAISKSLQIGSIEYLLYGKSDVMKEDTIYDIKFTTKGSNYDVGKYQDSAQHRIYLYCSGLPKFAYLISDGNNFWREDYVNHDKIEDEIKAMIAEFISYIKSDAEMAQLYFGRWNAK